MENCARRFFLVCAKIKRPAKLFEKHDSGIALVRGLRRKYGEVMKVKVIVMPKAAVLDPMRHLGMPEVRRVRIGKYMEIDVDGKNGELEARLHGLCRDLLSNPVIEDYELEKAGSGKQEKRKTKSPR